MRDTLTFGLAYAGYLLLGLDMILHAWRRPSRFLTILTAAVVLVHVALVWAWRFEWSLSYAWEKSWAGFVIFHGALVLVVAAALVSQQWRRRLIFTAFPIVTAGAMGAVFRYDVVSVYQIPVFVASTVALFAALFGVRKQQLRSSA